MWLKHLRSSGKLWTCSVTGVHLVSARCLATSVKGDILKVYKEKIKDKELDDDPYQNKVAQSLQNLNLSVARYTPPKPGFFDKLFMKAGHEQPLSPKGLYLYGSVGCGKTMLMDLFYENCLISKSDKRRVHFHSFMLDVHHRIHEFKKDRQVANSSKKALSFNPIPLVAQNLVDESWLLCLDEFQVTDIGDAMVLKQLFKALFANGAVVVATSNRAPDDLYKNGLQRSNFLPFIPLLKTHCDVHCLDSGVDYRLKSLPSKQRIYLLTEEKADVELDRLFKIFASRENDTIRPKTLNIKNRNVLFNKTCGRIADCTFDELCDRALGAVDYLAMSQLFHTVIVRDIPQLTTWKKTQARRFITLIDTFYDNNVRMLFSATVPVKELFCTKRTSDEISDEDRNLMDDLGIKHGSHEANASIFSGEEETFAFARTISRLTQMQTQEYWNKREVF
ncbi:putative ATPase N2B [Halotydeus destructor]|nr:putative ATPase N2B [Halotydeus destructor]